MRKSPKNVKIQSSRQYLFALLGYASVKALHKMLMKLTPGALHALALPSHPADRHPRSHAPALLLRHHLHHPRQLLRHDQA